MPRPSSRRGSTPKGDNSDTYIRIVGGKFRGRRLAYSGDRTVRPMKDRVRESLFNLLGPEVQGAFAIDLFGGTGALAFEAISRGATRGLIIERHLPTARVIRDNISNLGLVEFVQLVRSDTFHWYRQTPSLPGQPWVVFCSPPYRFFQERSEDLLEMISGLLLRAPNRSLFAVEATDEFDFGRLPNSVTWDVRSYPPAMLAVKKVDSDESS